MNKKTAKHKKPQGFLSTLLLFLILLTLLGISTIIYLYITNKEALYKYLPQRVTEKINNIEEKEDKITYDTSKWLTYPPKGSDMGWTIKYPKESIPIDTEKDTRISIFNEEQEAILITFNFEDNLTENIQEYLRDYKENDRCDLKTDFTKISLNDYESYKSTSNCWEENNTGDSIFLKDKTAYIIVSPYAKRSYLVIKAYIDKDIAKESNINLMEQILETVVILEPEKPLGEGLIGFYDVNLGFSIIYPDTFKAVEDSGWKNIDLLLYSGGQVYDLAIQVWNSEAEYKAYLKENFGDPKYVTVHKIKDKYVTFFNMAESEEVEEIIKSFKLEEE